jgi:hypothetical protein
MAYKHIRGLAMDFSSSAAFWTSYTTSNIVALLLLFSSLKKPITARFLYSLLFLWAGIVNIMLAKNNPASYLTFAEFAVFPLYKNFILGWFSEHVSSIVTTVAITQFLVAICMWLKAPLFKIGAIAGIIFLISVVPLGLISAVPATIIMATGLVILLLKPPFPYLWTVLFKELFTMRDRFSDEPEN